MRCPRCRRKVRGWRITVGPGHYRATTRQSIRHALRSHFDIYHPELGIRERSLLLDRAVRNLALA